MTAWGENGPVSVEHGGSFGSDSLPYQPKEGSKGYSKPKPVLAEQGEVCEGLDERTGNPFPSCRGGLVCIDSGAITIPGAGNVCVVDDFVITHASDPSECEEF